MDDFYSADWKYLSRGRHLTRLAAMWGVKRRWFGLEPDYLLRRRVLAAMGAKP